MLRFLHTADWHLGLRLRFVAGEPGVLAQRERFEVVRRMAELAHDHDVHAVVVAGDVFDDNAVSPWVLQAARDALKVFAPRPVLLLPGNHDAAVHGGALERLAPQERGLGHVHVLLDRPFELAGGVFFPCPLTRRHSQGDPTADLPERSPGEGVRIAVAHGGVLDFSSSTESPNRIDAQRVVAKGFDYLALGDWHGTFHMGSRIWYPGTPEPTRFSENRPGQALIVEVDGPGAEPRVEEVRVARSQWLEKRLELLDGGGSVEELESWLHGLEERSLTLMRLELDGVLSLVERARLDSLLERFEGELLLLEVDDRGLSTAPSEADLERLRAEGFVGRAVESLRKDHEPAAADALRLLYRLLDGGGEA